MNRDLRDLKDRMVSQEEMETQDLAVKQAKMDNQDQLDLRFAFQLPAIL